jgi:BioD-like phosphotransacetylase family protein
MKNAIYIAATGQNVGKTTLCLGMIAAQRKRFASVGFIKPVGQQHVAVKEGIRVDKDAVLFKNHFQLSSEWQDMSPVIVPPGLTREYLDGTVPTHFLDDKIHQAFYKIRSGHSYTIVEGTGHVGVGSIIGLNNASVAAKLGLDVVIIASGGLGSAFDELSLNIAMCLQHGVKVRGVILNRVLEDKRDMILEYFPKTLKKWNIPLIGCVPYNSFLSRPTIKDFENLFSTTLLAGEKYRFRRFQNIRLVAGSIDSYLNEVVANELIITPACREDIIEAALNIHKKLWQSQQKDFEGGMILTGNTAPSKRILEEVRQNDMPVLYAPICSYDAMKMMTSYNAKIRPDDTQKVEQAISLIEKYVDFDILAAKPENI